MSAWVPIVQLWWNDDWIKQAANIEAITCDVGCHKPHRGTLMVTEAWWSVFVSLGILETESSILGQDVSSSWFWGRKSDNGYKERQEEGAPRTCWIIPFIALRSSNLIHVESSNTGHKVFARHSPIRSAPALDNNDLVADFITLQAMQKLHTFYIQGRAAWLNSTNSDPHYWPHSLVIRNE